MSKNTTPIAASQSLVTLTVTAAELAEIRSLVESSITCDIGYRDVGGVELAKIAEKCTPAFLRQKNARQAARYKAAGKEFWAEEPQEQSARLLLTAGIVRKLAARDTIMDLDLDTKLVRKLRKIAKAKGESLNQLITRGLNAGIAKAEAEAKAA